MVDSVDGAAFFILKGLAQSASFDHAKFPLGETGFRVKIGKPLVRMYVFGTCSVLRLRGRKVTRGQ
jgi:hypothetical protein